MLLHQFVVPLVALAWQAVVGRVCSQLDTTVYAKLMLLGFSPDPYLAGIAMEQTIVAIQESGVQAVAKRESISLNHNIYIIPDKATC